MGWFSVLIEALGLALKGAVVADSIINGKGEGAKKKEVVKEFVKGGVDVAANKGVVGAEDAEKVKDDLDDLTEIAYSIAKRHGLLPTHPVEAEASE